MRDILILIPLGIIFAAGYFLMGQIDEIIRENNKKIEQIEEENVDKKELPC